MPSVTFKYGGQVKKVEGKTGDSLLQIALDNDIPMEHACGGNGFCVTCLCKVEDGKDSLGERNDREENMGIVNEDERLGCQATLGDDDVTVELMEV